MNEHQQLLDTLGAKNQTEAMQIIAQFHAAQIAGMRNVPYGWKVLPEDYSSHHTDWTKAVRIALEAATAEGSDTSYWQHQLKTLDDIRKSTIEMYEFQGPKAEPAEAPIRNTLWKHINGNEYTVLFVTNTAVERMGHNPDVVYQGVNGHIWSRPLADWYRSFTYIGTHMDSDRDLLDAIHQAVKDQTWMPKEYMANDWIADILDYLRNGPSPSPNPEDLRFLGEALAGIVIMATDRADNTSAHTRAERARWGMLAKDLAPVLLAWQRVYAALGSPK